MTKAVVVFLIATLLNGLYAYPAKTKPLPPINQGQSEIITVNPTYQKKVFQNNLKPIPVTTTIPELIPLLKDPVPHTRLKALNLIQERIEKKHAVALYPLLEAHSPWVRHQALKLLVKLQESDKILPQLRHLLNQNEPLIKIEAIKLAGQLHTPLLLNELLPLIHHPIPEIRAATAWSLGEIGDFKATETLIKRLDDPDFCTQYEVIKALGKLGNPEAIPHLNAFKKRAQQKLLTTIDWSLNEIDKCQFECVNF